MNALSQILNIIDYRTWKDVCEMLNAIEEMKYILALLDSANTEAEFTTTRHLLHVDCSKTENEGIIQTVIDVGNSEGLGHSFSIEHKVGN